MRTFYYVHTGHRVGLDRFRRASAIINALPKEAEITLLCSDFRIAHEAKTYGIKESVGIDVVRNIPQIAQNGDKIIFDSVEANPVMLDDMRRYFSNFVRVSDDANDTRDENEFLISPYLQGEGICNAVAVDDTYFQKCDKTTKITYFFGDDDYEKDLEKHLNFIGGLECALGMGFYYFLDYEDMLRNKFEKIYEFEEYEAMIKQSEILITASPQAILESLASGSKPIYFQREDYPKDFQKLFQELNVPIIENYDKNRLFVIIQTIENNKYQNVQRYSNKISEFLKKSLNL